MRFTDDAGIVTYYATYTAFDGVRVLPQLIETTDFVSFRVLTLSGVCSQNKGAALFPRKIDGHFVALSRFDTENNYVMRTDNLRIWSSAEKVESPQFPWDLARIGNCGSMIHGDQLILPYGHADMTTRIATIPLDVLLHRLSAGHR